nr:hypothetical protein [Tanacetum cinerariifolium]
MDDPYITMEEYIRLEEEKVCRRGKVYNWETATYDNIWCNEDIYDLRSIETEFSAIVLNDAFTSKETLSCEPTVSPLNDNNIDFRISFDESDDEDYTSICLRKIPSPEPKVSYFDDLDIFKDFEKEFSAIVYNDALTSKLVFLTEPTVSPRHIDEFNLKDETSLSKCEEEERNVIYFNDLFPFNVIYPDELKSNKENDNDKIDINQASGGKVINTDDGAYAHGLNKLLETSHDKSNNFFKAKTFIKYCMEDPEQAFVEYASSRTDEAGGPQNPLLVGRGFLATTNAVRDCRMAKIAIGEGITRSIFIVKGVDLGEEEAPY